MIKVDSIKNTDSNYNSFKVSLFADNKAEVIPGAAIEGLPSNATIEMGSSVITANGELAFMKSDGTWNWI